MLKVLHKLTIEKQYAKKLIILLIRSKRVVLVNLVKLLEQSDHLQMIKKSVKIKTLSSTIILKGDQFLQNLLGFEKGFEDVIDKGPLGLHLSMLKLILTMVSIMMSIIRYGLRIAPRQAMRQAIAKADAALLEPYASSS